MTRRILQLLLVAALAAGLAAPAALAQTTGTSEPQAPTAVEPTAGTPAPAPVDPATSVPPTASVVPVAEPTTVAPTTTPEGASGASGAAGPQAAPSGGGGLSNGALAGIVAVGLLVLLLSLVVIAESRGWSSRRLDRWRHAAGEANWRMSLRAAEFRDFLRLGR